MGDLTLQNNSQKAKEELTGYDISISHKHSHAVFRVKTDDGSLT